MDTDSRTLEDLLSSPEYCLPPSLRNTIQYAIALSSSPSIPTSSALKAITRHLSGFGVYGAFPIIVPLHGGGGELCQAFCGKGGVRGGTYSVGGGIRECTRGMGGGYKVVFDVEEGEDMAFVYCTQVVREREGGEGDGEEGDGSEITRSIRI